MSSSLKPTKAAKSSKNPASKSNAATDKNTKGKKASHPTNNPLKESIIVRLNVGGTRYDTSRATLGRCEGSKLANLVSDSWKEGVDPIFIDRNGLLFQYVLDYLRSNEVHLPTTVSRAAVMKEFEYYEIDADIQTCSADSIDSFIEKAEAARIEQLANQVTVLAEDMPSGTIYLPASEFLALCGT